MKSAVLPVAIVCILVGWVYFQDEKEEERNLVFDCAMQMAYKAAIYDGFMIQSEYGGNRNYEVNKRKDGNTYVVAYASKSMALEEFRNLVTGEKSTTANQVESYENGYLMRCRKTTEGASTFTVVEKIEDSSGWVLVD